MARIPDSVIQEILDKADIESVVGQYVSFTKRSGNNLFGLCPFHSEKTASFSVSINKNIYHCFGCQKGGNAINFIMEIERLNYPEAIRFLGAKYNVNVPEDDFSGNNENDLKEKKDRVYSLLTEAARYFYKSFNADNPEAKAARQYAKKRNLAPKTLTHFGIGYAPDGWDKLVNHLVSKGYTEDEMKNSGLFTVSRKTGKLIDLFRGRLMFPIFDSFGKIIAFGGRAMGDEMPKYVNSPDSLVYKKQEHLYALNFAKEERSKQLIIVEGYMDAIAMHQAGVKNTVASLGTAFTDSQLRMCARYSEEVIFFFDADKAGQSAALRAIKMMLQYLRKMTGLKIKIKIAKVPGGKDPDEYIRNEGADKFRIVVDNAKYVDDYLTDRAYDDNYEDGKGLDMERYQDDICLYGSWLNDEIKRSKMAANASVYLKARPEIIVNRMNALSENADAQQKILDNRRIRTEVENNYIPDDSYMDPGTADEPIQIEQNFDDVASEDEINLFAYAVNLKERLVDTKLISKEDIFRPSDFKNRNMKELVAYFLKNFDVKKGVSEALLMNKMGSYMINGQPAVNVFYFAFENSDRFSNIQILSDMYKRTLYKMRIEFCRQKEAELTRMLSYASNADKEVIVNQIKKVEYYRGVLQGKGANL